MRHPCIRSLPILCIGSLLSACVAARPIRSPDSPTPPPAAPLPLGSTPAPTTPAMGPVLTTARVSIAAVGDVLMHDAVKRSAQTHGAGGPDGGYGWLFEPVSDLLARADLAFANLETPIAPTKGGGTREYVFNSGPDIVGALAHGGVDAVAVANNHAFDQGRPGFEETLATLDALGMRRVGAGPAPRAQAPEIFEVGGLRLAFLAWAHFVNQDGNDCPSRAPCAQLSLLDGASEEKVAEAEKAVAAAAAHADAVIVSLHWGTEYQRQPRAEDVALAHRLSDAGASVILGHHPHVLQPIELYRRSDGRVAVIAYSLGNFVSNQSRGYVFGVTPDKAAATRDGALLEVELVKRDYGRGVVRVEVGGAGYVPLWTENDTAEIDTKKEPGRRPRIRVVAVDRALAEARAAIASLPEPLPPERRQEWVRLRNSEALLLARKEAIGRVLGADLERAAPVQPPATPVPAGP